MAFCDFFFFFLSATRDSAERSRRIRFLARSNLFLIVDWETLYGCGKFLSDSKPLEFQTVAWGLETHKVNLDFCGINESDCFLSRLFELITRRSVVFVRHQMGDIILIRHPRAPAGQRLWKAKRIECLTSVSKLLTVISVSARCLWGRAVTSPNYVILWGCGLSFFFFEQILLRWFLCGQDHYNLCFRVLF